MNWILDKDKNIINLSCVNHIWIQYRGKDYALPYQLIAETSAYNFILAESEAEDSLEKEKLDLYSKLVNNFDAKSLYNVRY